MLASEDKLQLYIYSVTYVDVVQLSSKMKGSCWIYRSIETGKEACLEIQYQQGNWHLLSNEKYQLIKGMDEILSMNKIYTIHCLQEDIHVLATRYHEDYNQYIAYEIQVPQICIGRSELCDIAIDFPYISMQHAVLSKQLDTWILKDVNSKNGVYVNSKRVTSTSLQCGDIIHIMGTQILFGFSFLCVSKKNKQKINVESLKKLIIPIPIPIDYVPFHYQASIKKDFPLLEENVITIEYPGGKVQGQDMPLWYLLGPSITMGLSSISMGFFSILQSIQHKSDILQTLPTIVMSFSMAIGTILWPLLAKRYEKKKERQHSKERVQAYKEYLQHKQEDIENYLKYRECIFASLYENLEMMCRSIENKTVLLYHRRREDPSWLCLTLGKQKQLEPIVFEYQKQEFKLYKDDVVEAMEQIVQKQYYVEREVVLSLKEEKSIGIYGEDGKNFLHSLILEIATFHRYSDIKLILLLNECDSRERKLRWLPHVYADDFQERYVFVERKSVASLNTLFEKASKSESSVDYVIVSFDREIEKGISVASLLEKYEHVMYLQYAKEKHNLNPVCHSIIEVDDSYIQVQRNFQTYRIPSYSLPLIQLIKLTQQLGNVREDRKQTKYEVNTISILDLYACGNLEQLNIEQRWIENNPSLSLEVMIGIDTQGNRITLDTHEVFQGPHGLIAGMTGSGKSEFIISFILSLAINFSCEEVSFVLIDYKGGMMAKALHGLPHIAGVITNLEKENMFRIMRALKSEVERRQIVLMEVGKKYHSSTMDIYKYQKLKREHQEIAPLTHLFIIADEFAELKQQQNEFMGFLKQIARIGRSLGFHLILATQKPYGVVDDQIWSNSRFHLCLKVQDRNDSLDMLKKEDASFLKDAGEFYLQVGNDESYVRGRSAYTQCPYVEHSFYQKPINTNIILYDNTMKEVDRMQLQDTVSTTCGTQLDALIAYLKKKSEYLHLHVDSVAKEALSYPLYQTITKKVMIGIVDDVFHQQQYPLTLSFTNNQHFFIAGMQDSGSLECLQTILIFCILQYESTQLEIYVLDFYDSPLSKFAKSTIVQDILYAQEKEKGDSLFQMLQERMQSKEQQTECLLIIHGYEQFHEEYKQYDDLFYRLLREGKHKHLHICISVEDTNEVPYRFLSFFDRMFLFQLNDKSEYHTLLQVPLELYPLHQKGSAITKVKEEVLLLQIAEYSQKEQEELLKTHHCEVPLHPIPMLPSIVSIDKATTDNIFLGLNLISKQSVNCVIEQGAMLYIGYMYQFNIAFVKVFIEQMIKQYNCLLFSNQSLFELHPIQDNEDILNRVSSLDHAVIFWRNMKELRLCYSNETIEQCLLIKTCTHIVFASFEQFQAIQLEEWGSRILYEASILWLGKGLQDASYALKLPTEKMSQHLQKNQAMYWKDGEITWLQLVEEIKHG